MCAAIPAPPAAGNQANIAPAPPAISTTPVSWLQGARVGLLLAAYLAMAEIDRLTADVLDKDGQSWSLTTLMGPARLFDRSTDGWTATGFTTDGGRLFGWMLTYLLVDAIFIVAYGWLLAGWLGWTTPVKLLVGLDLAEDVVAAFYGRPAAHPGLAWVPITVSGLKWAAVIVVLLVLLRRLTDPADASWRSGLVRLRRALFVHRFSLVPLVPVAALGLISGPNILDQLPDIQRQWGDTDAGHRQAAAAAVVLVLLGIGLFVLGRMRSEFARQRAAAGPAAGQPDPNLMIYVVGPALVLAGVLLNRGIGVVWWRAALFCVVPLLVVGGSLLLRNFKPDLARPGLKALDLADVPTITLVGDVLAILPLVIGGLALVRSYTAVVALEGHIGAGGGANVGADGWERGALAVGVAGATLGWLVGVGLINLVASLPWLNKRMTVGDATMFSQPLRWAAMTWWLALFLLLYLAPLFVASLGVIACVLLALAALGLMLGSFAVIAQHGGAPEVLWKLGFRAAPLTLLLIAAIILAGMKGNDTDVHATRNLPAASTAAKRDSLATAFDAWSGAPGCQVHKGTLTLRPMFLVAAEGGGIRAAYWTAAALDRLVQANPCVGSSTLLSGGASGGAVGLTVARFTEPGASAAQVEAMADPTALAAGSLGLFVRDLAYAATGVPAPALGSEGVTSRLRATGNGEWADRAALIEAVWQTQASGLDGPFVGGTEAAFSPTGALVLTSTSVGTGCRYLVSQVTLSDSPAGADCATLAQPVAGSVDLLTAYAGAGKEGDHCAGPLLAATAAMFASRFPFVTPSGVVGPCGAIKESDQLVDGGYVENSGLGTIVDLADQWLPLVRQHNTEQLRSMTSPTLFVPVVLYMDNGTGSDLRPPSLKVTDEILVPWTANKRAGVQQSDTPTLLQRAATLVAADNLWDSSICPVDPKRAVEQKVACDRVKSAGEQIGTWRPRPVVVVHQSTFPAVTAPLGWTLSQKSITTMNNALAQQASVKCRPEIKDLLCARQLGSLADALALLPARS